MSQAKEHKSDSVASHSCASGNSIEHLLKPRYKVIADWPLNDHFTLNEIINLTEFDGRSHLAKEQQEYYVYQKPHNPGKLPMAFYESNFNKYPHLFKRLEWWEERQEEELPKFVKSNNYVYRITQYDLSSNTIIFDGHYQCSLKFFLSKGLPATKAEYQSYIQTIKQ